MGMSGERHGEGRLALPGDPSPLCVHYNHGELLPASLAHTRLAGTIGDDIPNGASGNGVLPSGMLVGEGQPAHTFDPPPRPLCTSNEKPLEPCEDESQEH